MESEMFYHKMQGYFDEGVVREVYASDLFSIASLGEFCYVVIPHIMAGNEPVAIYVNEEVIKRCIKSDRHFKAYLGEVLGSPAVYGQMIYYLDSSRVDFWKKWTNETRPKVTSEINPELEAEITQMNRKKGR